MKRWIFTVLLSSLSVVSAVSMVSQVSTVLADTVTRYTNSGTFAAKADTLYSVMTTGTPTASGDFVLLTGDSARGTGTVNVSAGMVLNIGSSEGIFAVNRANGETGSFLTVANSGVLNLSHVCFDGAGVTNSNNGGFIQGIQGGTTNILQDTIFRNSRTTARGGAVDGALNILDGTNLFENNAAPVNGGVVMGTVRISGGNNTFLNNSAVSGASGAIGENVIFLGGVNTFIGNRAVYGGAAHGSLTISGGDNTFRANSAQQGGAMNAAGDIKFTGGTTLFENNFSTLDGRGGAINIWFGKSVQFSGDDTFVLFRGNYNTASKTVSDIACGGATGGNSVTFTGRGTYIFGGGIQAPNLTATGGNIIFGEGSVTNISTSLSLTNTNLTLNFGSVDVPYTSATAFGLGSDGTITDGGGNTIKLIVDSSWTGSNTLITGNASGLKTVPIVQLSADQSGFAYISSVNTSGVTMTRSTAAANRLIHFSSANGSMTKKTERDTLYSASDAVVNGDVFVLTDSVTRGSAPVTLAANTKLTIQSASKSIRSVSMGNGESGRFLNASASGTTLVLDGVNFTGGSVTDGNGGAILGKTVILSGNTSFTANLALNGGAISADNVIISGSDSQVSFVGNRSTNTTVAGIGGAVQGKLTIDGGTNTFLKNTSTAGLGQNGGGVSKVLVVNDGTNVFSENSGQLGGVTMELNVNGGVNVFQNNAGVWGGVVYGDLNISGGNNVFDGNRATNGVGGIVQGNGNISGGNSVFTNNNATNWGGCIFVDYTLNFSGENTNAVFSSNIQRAGTSQQSQNDIFTFHNTSTVSFSGNGNYWFGGGISSAKMSVSGGNITLADGSVSNGHYFDSQNNAEMALGQTGGSVTLQGTATLQAKATVSGGSLNFQATPTTRGFGTLITSTAPTVSESGKMTVGMQGFTTIANGQNSWTLVKGTAVDASAFQFNDELFDISASGSDTILTLNTTRTLGDVAGKFQVNQVLDSDLEDDGSLDVRDVNFLVATENLDLFADWLGETTGLETVVATGYVSVKLDELVTVLGNDQFVWDFGGYSGHAVLSGATANQLSSLVPEPSSFLLLGLAAGLGLVFLRRKRGKKVVSTVA